ncbi:YhcN/YlaJ family sporulation lipoprotein [Paenibacillus sp. GSMTC-2017]|uniref:YhcN/YlaJ family sporulation lipoprotein n=1 Tax=Paenibacillus sp. GSMTC-2017 TaxID=2794350 RepID=UPI0018D9A42B|nr:YhcN/YlaJ family sporulation lipoprotein [Paenibacillus sp. GSMTC-2017]MBH5318519.1 YhcN/YlaJ family sporulation lipoprotein [Paenibacillus sp. GSMTC-2017]
MQKKMIALSATILLGTMLCGCSMEKQGDLGNKNISVNNVNDGAGGNLLRDKRFADDGKNEANRINGRRLNSNNLVGSHKNYNIQMSGHIADKVRGIKTVKASYVMLTDYNAYVAVSLVDTEPKGNPKMMSRTHIGLFGKEGASTGKRMSSFATGQEMLTDEIVAEVVKVVKETRPHVEHVYVSANPEFVGRMNAYMNDVNSGYPVQNYVMEFNGMVERLFPVAPIDNKTIRPHNSRNYVAK